jgi:uncharacterized protein (TIRG00374 family)
MKNDRNINFSKILRISSILIAVGVFANIMFSILTTDRDTFLSLGSVPVSYLFLAGVLALIPWITNTLRLNIWTRFLGKPVPMGDLFCITLGNDLGSAVSPTAIGGGYVKAGMLIEQGISPGAAASLMTLGSVEDGVFFALALPVAAILSSAHKMPIFEKSLTMIASSISKIPLLLAVVIPVGYLLISYLRRKKTLWSKVRKTGTDFIRVYRMISDRGKTRFALSIGLTAIQWACRYSVISALLASLNIPVHPLKFFLFQWIVFTLATFIPTPGAAFGAEAAFYVVYSAFIPSHVIGIATAGWRFLTYYFQLSIGAILFSVLWARKPIHLRKPQFMAARQESLNAG